MQKQINVDKQTYNLLKFYKDTGAITSISAYLSRLVERDSWRFIKDFDPLADCSFEELFGNENLYQNNVNHYNYADECYIPTAIKDVSIKWLKYVIWENQTRNKNCKEALLLLNMCKSVKTDDKTTIEIFLLDVLAAYCRLSVKDKQGISGILFCNGLAHLKNQLLKEFMLVPYQVMPELNAKNIKKYQQYFTKML